MKKSHIVILSVRGSSTRNVKALFLLVYEPPDGTKISVDHASSMCIARNCRCKWWEEGT